MKFRSRMFMFLAFLSFVWIIFGVFAEIAWYSDVTVGRQGTLLARIAESQAMDEWLFWFAVPGVLGMIGFGLLANANSRGLRDEERHQELLAAQRSNSNTWVPKASSEKKKGIHDVIIRDRKQ